jgi:DNA-binding LacI/PurR family transcriptional regulator
VLSVLRYELGLHVPEDVAVMGFDDVPLASAPEFSLTSVRQPLSQMVSHTVRILMQKIDGAPPERILLGPVLKARRSTVAADTP